jgi:hypothetical protein
MWQSVLKVVLEVLFRPESLSILMAALMFLAKAILKDRYDEKAAMFEKAVDVAFNVVNNVAKLTPNKIDDKVALGLKALSEYFKTHGKSASPAELERAKLLFQAMNGAGK